MLDSPQNFDQAARFAAALETISAAGFRPAFIHAGNSSTLLGQQMLAPLAALARKYQARFLVRPGLALYGYALPFVGGAASAAHLLPNLQPVLCWKTRIAALRHVPAGTAVGYGATFISSQEMRLALLPVGYADGFNRRLSNCGSVQLRGQRAAILGRVSMDLTVIDVSNIPQATVGDEVILLGHAADGKLSDAEDSAVTAPVTAYDHAAWAETIPYEILCAISIRVARVGVE
jgi:alanine racemase